MLLNFLPSQKSLLFSIIHLYFCHFPVRLHRHSSQGSLDFCSWSQGLSESAHHSFLKFVLGFIIPAFLCFGHNWYISSPLTVVVQPLSHVWLCYPMNCSLPNFPVLHSLSEFAHTYAIRSSHPLSPACPLALNLSQHQGLFQWVSSSHQVTKILELHH